MTSVGAKNYGSVSSDARAVSVRKDTFTGRKRARLSVKVAATIYVGEWSRLLLFNCYNYRSVRK